MSRLVLLSLFALFLGLVTATAPAMAAGVNCDLNACIAACQKNNPQGAMGRSCNSGCGFRIMDLKKKGQCK